MKKIILTSAALGLIASAAFAGGPGEIIREHKAKIAAEAGPTKGQGCNLIFPFSLFDEDVNGANCPATGAEKAAGQIMFGTVVIVGGAELMGAQIFPLNNSVPAAVAVLP